MVVCPDPHQITCPVHSGPRIPGVRVRAITLCSLARPIPIAFGQSSAADPQFSDASRPDKFQRLTQNIQKGVVNRVSNGFITGGGRGRRIGNLSHG